MYRNKNINKNQDFTFFTALTILRVLNSICMDKKEI